MKRLLVFMLVLVVGLCSCASAGTVEKGVIKIGALAGMTATQAMNGDMMVKNFQMYIDQVNAEGGIGGYTLELVYVDSADDIDSAINATNILLPQNDIVAVLGPQLSSQIFAIDELIRSSDIPFLVCGTNAGIPKLGDENIFGVRTNDSICARSAAKFLAEHAFDTPVTKVAIMCSTDDFSGGGQTEAVAYFDEIGMPYVVEPHNLDDTDFSSSIMKMQKEGCDAIFMWTQGNIRALLARQLYEADFNTVPIMSNIMDQRACIELCEPEWLEGNYCTSDFYNNEADPIIAKYMADFQAKYNEVPSSLGACYYSGICVLGEAMKKCENPSDRTQVKAALLQTKDVAAPTGVFNARPEINQQLIWGVNIVRRTIDSYEFVEFVQG